MANILLVTKGSGGDVFPFVEIGSTLLARGHDVTLLTHCNYANESGRAGLEFVALDSHKEFEQFIEDAPLLNKPTGISAFFQRHVLPKVPLEYEKIQERYRPGDTVLVSRWTPGIATRLAAENLGLPLVSVFMAPSNVNVMPIVEEVTGDLLGADINRVRAQVGLLPVYNWRIWWRSSTRHIGLWPDWFAPAKLNWSEAVVPVGFVNHDPTETGYLPQEIQEILGSCEFPILITGGTATFMDAKFYDVAATACGLLGYQGILVTRHPNQVPNDLPDGVKWFKYLPFANLMPYMEAVIHHGGMGTLGRALIAGIPQLVLATGGDRPDNARRLEHFGVAKFLPLSQWQPSVVASALRWLTQSPAVRECGKELSNRLRHTAAAVVACEEIEAVIQEWVSPLASHPSRRGNWNGENVESQKQNSKTAEWLQTLENLSPERRALLIRKLNSKDGEF